jgi:hypothetical protein
MRLFRSLVRLCVVLLAATLAAQARDLKNVSDESGTVAATAVPVRAVIAGPTFADVSVVPNPAPTLPPR